MKYLNCVFVAMLMIVCSSSVFGQAPVPDPIGSVGRPQIGGGGRPPIQEVDCEALYEAWVQAECDREAMELQYDDAADILLDAQILANNTYLDYQDAVAANEPAQVIAALRALWLAAVGEMITAQSTFNEKSAELSAAEAAEAAAIAAYDAGGC